MRVSRILIMVTVLALSLQVVSATERGTVVKWGSATLAVKVVHPPEVSAGSDLKLKVLLRAEDMEEGDRIRVDMVKVEVPNTAISVCKFPMRYLYEGEGCEFEFNVTMSDPSFSEISPGTKRPVTLKVNVVGSTKEEGFEGSLESLVYVVSPRVSVLFEVSIPDEVGVDEWVEAEVVVRNLGPAEVSDLHLSVEGVGVDLPLGRTIPLIKRLLPGEVFSKGLRLKFTNAGLQGVWFTLSYLNPAGYNISRVWGETVKVLSRSSVELHASEENGTINVWGWVRPGRPYTHVKLLGGPCETRLREIATLGTDATGFFNHSLRPSAPGNYCFIAEWEGDSEHLGSKSRVVNVTLAKIKPTVVLGASPLELRPGETLTLRCTIEPKVDGRLAVMSKYEDGWRTLDVVDVKGGSLEYKLRAERGMKGVKVVWLGNDRTYPSESTEVMVTVSGGSFLRLAIGGVQTVVWIVPALIAALIAVVWYVRAKRA